MTPLEVVLTVISAGLISLLLRAQATIKELAILLASRTTAEATNYRRTQRESKKKRRDDDDLSFTDPTSRGV